MIQRRQTLYLLTIVVLGIVLFFCSVIQFTTTESSGVQRMFFLNALGVEEVTPDMDYVSVEPIEFKGVWGLTLTTALIPLLALIDIFLYKKRLLQARLNIFLAFLCIGYYGILLMYAWFMRASIRMTHYLELDWNICFGACVPLVCLVLTIGATRLILKDEALVRAAGRIR